MKKTLLKNSQTEKKISRRLFLLFFTLICSCWITAFANPIKGKVIDSKGESIIGASIRIKGNEKVGTISDSQGNFSIEASETSVLLISYIGYRREEIPVKGQKLLKIVLNEDVGNLNEVVVVGYSTQKKETLTGSIATVESKELLSSSMSNISNSLVGRVTGIVSNQGSGEPGDNASTIRIRGASTLNASGQDPLIIIDGVQSTSQTMNALDPNEIAGISVLKDASATAVYGVKGANGVIIVTTKRGNAGTAKISMSYRYGTTKLTSELKPLNSYDYAVYRNEAIANDNDPSKNSLIFTDDELWKFKNNRDYTPAEVSNMTNLTEAQKEILLNSPALYYGSHDYYHELMGGSSPQQQYNINISGGSEKMKYFVSLGSLTQDGNIQQAQYGGMDQNSKYKRYNFRSNIDINIVKNLKMSVDFGGQVEGKQGILDSNSSSDSFARHKALLVMVYSSAPFSGPGIYDGKLIDSYSKNSNPLASKGSSGYSPISTLFWNPLLQTTTTNFNSTFNLVHKMDYLTKGLTLSGTFSYNDVYTKGVIVKKQPSTYVMTRNPSNPTEMLFFGGIDKLTTITDNTRNYKWNRIYMESKLAYARTFGKHAVTGLILYNIQTTNDPGLAYNVPTSLIGTAARVTYGYADRYLAEFNMGYNGSENFPEGKRFGFFPAMSLGWVVSNESFFPKNSFMSWLKIRGSYGEVGNDQIGGNRYLYLPSTWNNATPGAGTGNGYYFGNSNGTSLDPYYAGVTEGKVGNPNVTWERARKSNIGADWYFFKDRLTLTGDYFQENRDNILWNLGTLPAIVGATLAPANLGKVKNHGYEISVGWNDKIKDFKYSISFNISYAKNTIEFMDEPSYPYQWMNATGFSLGQYRGYKTEGFYNTQQEASNRPFGIVDGNKVAPGDFKYVDINGDGKIDDKDMVPIGYSNLPQYYFGSNIKLEYKGFSIAALITGSRNGSIPISGSYLRNPFYMTLNTAFQFQYDGHWTAEKAAEGITSTFPRASLRTSDTQNGVANDAWIQSTDFVRLKNLELAYDFTNKQTLKKIGLSGVRLYVNGNNLLTFDKMIEGFDPEQLDAGGANQGWMYPPTQSFNFGINVQF